MSSSPDIFELCPDNSNREQLEVIAQRNEFFSRILQSDGLQVDTLETFQKARPAMHTPLAERETQGDNGVVQALYAVILSGNCAYGIAQAQGRSINTCDTYFITQLSEGHAVNNAEFIQRLRPYRGALLGGKETTPDGEDVVCPRFSIRMDGAFGVTVGRELDDETLRPLRKNLNVISAGPYYSETDRRKYVLDQEDRAWNCEPRFLAAQGVFSKKALRYTPPRLSKRMRRQQAARQE